MRREFARVVALFTLAALLLCALGNSPAHAITFSIGANFEGTDLNAAFGLGSGSIPPDTMGAVGPSHVAELINTSFAVYNKAGTLQTRVSHNTFWDTAFSNAGNPGFVPSGAFDPRIIYDDNTDRWYAAAVDNRRSANSRVLIGVTTGNDPSSANWRGFEIDADTNGTRWADFPTLGINADNLYISNTMFDNNSPAVLSAQTTFMGVPLSSLTNVVPSITGARVEELIDPNKTGFALQPAVDMDGGSGVHPGVSAFNTTYNKRTEIPSDWITSGSNIPNQLFPNDFAAQAVVAPPTADQPGTSNDLNTGDNRFSGNVILQNGSLWGVQAVENSGRSAVRWYEFTDVAGQFTIDQTGLISDPSLDLYFPSIAVNDNGDVVVGFSGSDSTTPVSTYVALGETTAGTTTFDPISQTHAGVGEYQRLDSSGRNRWGDYSATVIDPSDSDVFWTFQEYVDGDDNWAVRITEIDLSPPVDSDTVITVDTGTTPTPIAFGKVILNDTASEDVKLDKTGAEATTYTVTPSNDGLSDNASGTFAGGVQTETFQLSLVANTNGSGTTGNKNYTVTVDNEAATSAAAGQGSLDPDDVFNVTATIVDRSEGSFAGGSDLDTLLIDFGTVALGSSPTDIGFGVFNLEDSIGFTAALDLDSITFNSGDAGKFMTDLAMFSDLAAGDSNSFLASFIDTSSAGTFSAQYLLGVSDEDIPGAAAGTDLILNITGIVQASGGSGEIPEPSTFTLCLLAGLGFLRRRRLGM